MLFVIIALYRVVIEYIHTKKFGILKLKNKKKTEITIIISRNQAIITNKSHPCNSGMVTGLFSSSLIKCISTSVMVMLPESSLAALAPSL